MFALAWFVVKNLCFVPSLQVASYSCLPFLRLRGMTPECSWREGGRMLIWAGGLLVVVKALVLPLVVDAIAEFGAPLVSTAVKERPLSKWNEMTRTKTKPSVGI